MRFCWPEFGEFPLLVGRYCRYLLPEQAGGTPQIHVDKTSCMTGRLRVYWIQRTQYLRLLGCDIHATTKYKPECSVIGRSAPSQRPWPRRLASGRGRFPPGGASAARGTCWRQLYKNRSSRKISVCTIFGRDRPNELESRIEIAIFWLLRLEIALFTSFSQFLAISASYWGKNDKHILWFGHKYCNIHNPSNWFNV